MATPGSGLGQPLRVRWEVARDRHFRRLVDRGTVLTSPRSAPTVKIDVRGLRPYTRYYYRFRAAGETSPVGRTQTAPDERGRVHALRFGLVSCSNYTGGYFGAYRALARRDDLDFVLHVGDYFYEYGNGPDRSAQVDAPGSTTTGGGFIPAGIGSVEAQLADPSRQLPEPEQLDWLKDTLARRGRQWHLIGNQVILAPVRFPGAILGGPAGSTFVNSDQWDGYQADQAELIAHLEDQPERAGDAVVLTGDIHSSWAMDIPAARSGTGYTPAGVEFVCPSVTSDGFYELVRASQPAGTPVATLVATTRGITGAVTAANPWIRYLDGIGHGYTLIDVTPERVQADYHLTPTPTADQPDPRVDRGTEPAYARSFSTLAGSRRVSAADGPVGERSDEPTRVRDRD